MATADVTIRGAGIFGLSAAWACLARGARVRVIDPNGVGSGSSGGVVGALSPHTPDGWNAKKAFQLDCLLSAEAHWAAVRDVSGIDPGYARSGRLQPVADDRALALARDREAAAEANWRGATWRVVEADGEWAPLTPTGWVIADDLSARIAPDRACSALAAGIAARGGEIVAEGPEEGAVLHATGWQGLHDLSGALGRPVGSGVKGQAVLLRHAAPPGAAQIFAGGLHIVPHATGTVAVGSTSERAWDHPDTTDAACDALAERAADALPILHGAEILRRWAGVRPRAESRGPLLDRWPGRPGHFVMNGGFKIGFGIAHGLADLAADLALGGDPAVPAAFRFDPALA